MTTNLYIFESLLNASSQDQIFNFLEGQCGQLGYSAYTYAPLIGEKNSEKIFNEGSIACGETLVTQNIFTTYPSTWVHRYQEAGHFERDSTIKLAIANNLPVFWNDVAKSECNNVVLDEARQHGLANGITVPVYGPNGCSAIFGVATDTLPENSSKHSAVTAGLILLTALHVHEATQRIAQRMNKSPLYPRLTVREKDCLQWAANGKTSWEIANILSVSERTVTYHIVNATKKLNATNRRQAVVRAISLKIIHP